MGFQFSAAGGAVTHVLYKPLSILYHVQVTGEDIEAWEQNGLEITGNITLDITVCRTVTDIDGNAYHTVKIGDQWWMAENLKVTHYRNGDTIPNVTVDRQWTGLNSGAYCYFDNNPSYGSTYGYLYNWFAVDDPRSLVPEGWQVPSDEECKQLEIHLGMSQSEVDETGWRVTGESGKLNESGPTYWDLPNTGATNESGFSALPGGYRYDFRDGFASLGICTDFWSSTEYDSENSLGAWTIGLGLPSVNYLQSFRREILRAFDSLSEGSVYFLI